MPRRPSAGSAGIVFHVMNRATRGQVLFRDFGEYLAFQHIFARALAEVPIRLLAYCLMPNHWHMVLWPGADAELTTFVRWLSMTHARSLHRWRGSEGTGAVYQGRFRAVPVDTEAYFYRLVRYVERNPVRAQLVERVEDWIWSSASGTAPCHGIELAAWPVPRPRDWLRFANDVEPPCDVDFVRARTARSEPISDTREADFAVAPE